MVSIGMLKSPWKLGLNGWLLFFTKLYYSSYLLQNHCRINLCTAYL